MAATTVTSQRFHNVSEAMSLKLQVKEVNFLPTFAEKNSKKKKKKKRSKLGEGEELDLKVPGHGNFERLWVDGLRGLDFL